MAISLLILHFLAFSIGIGGGIANLVIGSKAAAADPVTKPVLGAASRAVGQIASVGLLFLWITGIAMVYTSWEGWASLPQLFWAKFAGVLVLTACSVLMNMHVIRAKRTGTPPPPATMRRLGIIGSGAAILALILAVQTFAPGT